MKRNTQKTGRGEMNMCQKIKEINALTSDQILEKRKTRTIPINMKEILRDIGIVFQMVDFSDLQKKLKINKDDAILGMAFSNGDELGILYSNKIAGDAKNYVLAHELAHCCLHLHPSETFHVELKFSRDMYSEQKRRSFLSLFADSVKEIQADKFAAEILIPTDDINQYICKNQNATTEEIAKYFHVPEEIVRLKLSSLRR